MDEELYEPDRVEYVEPISVCKCLRPDSETSDVIEIPERKKRILTIVSRTEDYMKTRRIPELIQFLFTKVLTAAPAKPVKYLENLMDSCMLFRAGLGGAPVVYEKRSRHAQYLLLSLNTALEHSGSYAANNILELHSHLEAMIKSFDPGNRGWLTSGQIRRLYTTIGLRHKEYLEDRVPCNTVLADLISTQEEALYELLSAGTVD